MCEILLCVKNRNPAGDLAFDCKMPKRGDVVFVAPDGWKWSDLELGQRVVAVNGNHPFFRVIKFPNVTVAQASNLLAPELDVDPQNPSPYLQYRARYLDYTKINPVTAQALKEHWDDDGRANGFIVLNYTAAQVQTIVSTRPPIAFI